MENKKVKISVNRPNGVVEKMEVVHPDMNRYLSMFGGYTETDLKAIIHEKLALKPEHICDIKIDSIYQ